MKTFREFLLEDIKPSIDFNTDYYSVLGLSSSATETDIKKAYRTLSMKYHPDRNPNKDTTEQFKEIKLAYDILSDKKWRSEYDNKSSDILDDDTENWQGPVRNYSKKDDSTLASSIEYAVEQTLKTNKAFNKATGMSLDDLFSGVKDKFSNNRFIKELGREAFIQFVLAKIVPKYEGIVAGLRIKGGVGWRIWLITS